MRINHNISAQNTHRQYMINNNNQSKSLEKLSSGQRINKAADDAAGLAISEKMRGQIRGLEQAERNAQDGISLIQTAEGALNETHSILQRMRELSVQSANDTNTSDDRAEIQKEMDQLTLEIDRIANNTEFNSKKLLNGSASIQASITDADATDAASELVILGGTGDTKAGASITIDDITAATKASDSTGGVYATANTQLGAASTITLNGTQFSFDTTNTVQDVLDTVNNAGIAVEATYTAGGAITFSSSNVGSAAELNVANATGDFAAVATATGTDAALTAGFTGFSSYTAKGDEITIQDGNAKGLTFSLADGGDLDPTTDTTITIDSNGGLSFQIGANAGQSVYVSVGDMRSASLGVNSLDVSTKAGADTAITTIDTAIKSVSAERSKLGAYQNRLEHTINNLGTSAENLTSAESRIRDVDMAKEYSEYTKHNILTQAATSMLAQANQQTQGVLQLLR